MDTANEQNKTSTTISVAQPFHRAEPYQVPKFNKLEAIVVPRVGDFFLFCYVKK